MLVFGKNEIIEDEESSFVVLLLSWIKLREQQWSIPITTHVPERTDGLNQIECLQYTINNYMWNPTDQSQEDII